MIHVRFGSFYSIILEAVLNPYYVCASTERKLIGWLIKFII